MRTRGIRASQAGREKKCGSQRCEKAWWFLGATQQSTKQKVIFKDGRGKTSSKRPVCSALPKRWCFILGALKCHDQLAGE